MASTTSPSTQRRVGTRTGTARDYLATCEATAETRFFCPECQHIDGRITGMEMHWYQREAHTEKDRIALGVKVYDRAQVFLDITCNNCGQVVSLRIGEAYPGGELGIERIKEL